MKKTKLFTIAFIVTILVITQFAMVSAAPSLDETDSITGSIFSVSVIDESGHFVVEIILTDEITGDHRTVLVSPDTAHDLGLVDFDDDGRPVPVDSELWPEESITIDLDDILPTEEEAHHPVGNALATFFADLPGVDYNAIMAAHQDGYGFGVIAQALWLTQKLEGDAGVLTALLEAKETGDYSAFTLEDGTVPTSWGQLRKAIMDGDKKSNLGVVMSNKDKDKGNGNAGNNGDAENPDNNKDKSKDKGNNGNNSNNDNNGNNGNNGNKDNNGKNKP